MNRQEAYRLLSERLEHLASMEPLKLDRLIDVGLVEYVADSAGITYQMTFRLDGTNLKGQIHDNNSQKFTLLEESVSVSK